jgi:hypothetical protein
LNVLPSFREDLNMLDLANPEKPIGKSVNYFY